MANVSLVTMTTRGFQFLLTGLPAGAKNGLITTRPLRSASRRLRASETIRGVSQMARPGFDVDPCSLNGLHDLRVCRPF